MLNTKNVKLNSETLIYSEHGIFVIIINNLSGFLPWYQGTKVGAGSPNALIAYL
jgi:hypothetical protein